MSGDDMQSKEIDPSSLSYALLSDNLQEAMGINGAAADETRELHAPQPKPPAPARKAVDDLAKSLGIHTVEDADEAARDLHGGLTHYPGHNGEARPITWKSLLTDKERISAANWWKDRRAKQAAAAPKAPPAAAPAPNYVTHAYLQAFADQLMEAIVPALGDRDDAIKKLGETNNHNVDVINKRTTEIKELQAQVAELTAKLAKLLPDADGGASLKHVDRRVSRHSDHLLNIEARVKKLEGK